MPTWDSVVGWGNRGDRVVDKMQTVYPRYLAIQITENSENSQYVDGADSG